MVFNAIMSNLNETKAGTWKVRWREHGKTQQRTFRRKADALRLQSELYNGKDVPVITKNIAFEDFCEVWKKRHCEINIDPSTAKDYSYKVGANILPYFKGKALAAIDEDDVIKFKEWLTSVRRFKAVTVGNHIRLVKLIFKCACRWKDENKTKYLVENPAINVKEPKKPEPDFKFWTSTQIKQFLKYTSVKAPVIHEVALVTTATGLRRGELHQLQRDCIDFENRIITVKRSFSFASRMVKHTKANRIRRIPMNAEVYNVLNKFNAIDDQNKRIFEGVNIEHFHKPLQKWCKKAGVPEVGLHDLRDTFASSLVKAGIKIKVIQRLMGHLNISVTEKYMHLDPSDLVGSTDCLLLENSPTEEA